MPELGVACLLLSSPEAVPGPGGAGLPGAGWVGTVEEVKWALATSLMSPWRTSPGPSKAVNTKGERMLRTFGRNLLTLGFLPTGDSSEMRLSLTPAGVAARSGLWGRQG